MLKLRALENIRFLSLVNKLSRYGCPSGRPPIGNHRFTRVLLVAAFGAIGLLSSPDTHAAEVLLQLKLDKGWNMFSLPVTPQIDDSLEAFFVNKIGKVWAFRADSYEIADTLTAGEGYWVFMKQDTTIFYRGQPADLSPTLQVGWNMFATYEPLTIPGQAVGTVWTYINNRFAPVQGMLMPGVSYWINLSTLDGGVSIGSTTQDLNSNGIPDYWEAIWELRDDQVDIDSDSLVEKAEFENGTNPLLMDTDGDGLQDGAEVITHGTDPIRRDSDNDRLIDGDEITETTNPLKKDTDGDGAADGDEVSVGKSPILASEAPPGVKIEFAAQPGDATAGTSLPQIQVAIKNQFGNIARTEDDEITVAIGNNPSNGQLSGSLAVAATKGVVNFKDLSINQTGNGYTLVAFTSELGSVTSRAFNITGNTNTFVSGRVLDETGEPVPGAEVNMVGVNINSETTNGDGVFTFELTSIPSNRLVCVGADALGFTSGAQTTTIIPDRTVSVTINVKHVQAMREGTVSDLTDDSDNMVIETPDRSACIIIPDPDGTLGLGTGDSVCLELTYGNPKVDRDIFPGDFDAQNPEDTENTVGLASMAFGEITVMKMDGGTMTEISELNADITMLLAIPKGTINPVTRAPYVAGDIIAIWDFDEEQGQWVRGIDGNGDEINATVRHEPAVTGPLVAEFQIPHLSWWNADQPIDSHHCLVGKVVDTGGNAIANAEVIASGVDYNGEAFALTGPDGSYCMDVMRGSVVTLSARRGGLVTASSLNVNVVDKQSSCDAIESSSNVCTPVNDLVIAVSACISGSIEDESGNPVAGATVEAIGRNVFTTADGNGNYCIEGISRDDTIDLRAFTTINGQFISTTTSVTSSDVSSDCATGTCVTQDFTLTLDLACISGTVTDNGAPLPNVDVWLDSGGWTQTDGSGNYCVAAPKNSTETVNVSYWDPRTGIIHQDATSGITTTGTTGDCATTCTTAGTNFTLNLSTLGCVSGTVTDEDGFAVDGVQVYVPGYTRGVTGANGPAGEYCITAPIGNVQVYFEYFAPNGRRIFESATFTTTGDTCDGGCTDVLDKTITVGQACISGKVVLGNGSAVSGVQVSSSGGFGAVTDGSGNFCIEAINISDNPSVTLTFFKVLSNSQVVNFNRVVTQGDLSGTDDCESGNCFNFGGSNITVNVPPLILQFKLSSTSVSSGGTVQATVSPFDEDGDTLGYNWFASAGTLTPSMKTASWTAPVVTKATDVRISIQVSDGNGGTASGRKTVRVQPLPKVNQAPSITSLTGSPVTLGPNESAAVSVNATDPDGDALTYSWSAPNGGTITGTTANVSWTAPSTPGTYDVTVIVSDGKLTATSTVTFTVSATAITTLKISVVKPDGVTPAGGAKVLLHDNTGAITDEIDTGINAIADFGDIGQTDATYTVLVEDDGEGSFVTDPIGLTTDGNWQTVSLTDIPLTAFNSTGLQGGSFSGIAGNFGIEFLVGPGASGDNLTIDVDDIQVVINESGSPMSLDENFNSGLATGSATDTSDGEPQFTFYEDLGTPDNRRASWSEDFASAAAIKNDGTDTYAELSAAGLPAASAGDETFTGILDLPGFGQGTATGAFVNLSGKNVSGADISVRVRIPGSPDFPVSVRFLIEEQSNSQNEEEWVARTIFDGPVGDLVIPVSDNDSESDAEFSVVVLNVPANTSFVRLHGIRHDSGAPAPTVSGSNMTFTNLRLDDEDIISRSGTAHISAIAFQQNASSGPSDLPVKFGAALDIPLSTLDGATIFVTLDTDVTDLDFTATNAINNLSININRDGGRLTAGSYQTQTPVSSSEVGVGDLALQTNEFYYLDAFDFDNSTRCETGTFTKIGGTLPTNSGGGLTVAMPPFSLDSITPTNPRINNVDVLNQVDWSVSGTTTDLDLTRVSLEGQTTQNKPIGWNLIIPPGTTSIPIPKLPSDVGAIQSVTAQSTNAQVEISVEDFSSVSGYDDYLNQFLARVKSGTNPKGIDFNFGDTNLFAAKEIGQQSAGSDATFDFIEDFESLSVGAGASGVDDEGGAVVRFFESPGDSTGRRAVWGETIMSPAAQIAQPVTDGNKYLELSVDIPNASGNEFIGILDLPGSGAGAGGPYVGLDGDSVVGASASVDVRMNVTGFQVFVRFLFTDAQQTVGDPPESEEFVTDLLPITTDNTWQTIRFPGIQAGDLISLSGGARDFSGNASGFAVEFLVGTGATTQTTTIDIDNVHLQKSFDQNAVNFNYNLNLFWQTYSIDFVSDTTYRGAIPRFPAAATSYSASFNVNNDTGYPANVDIIGPTGSGLDDTTTNNFIDTNFASYGVNSKSLPDPSTLLGGIHTVQYQGDQGVKFDRQINAANQTIPLPTFTISAGNLTRIDWTYTEQTDGTAFSSSTDFITQIDVSVSDSSGTQLYQNFNIAAGSTGVDISGSVAWSDVAFVTVGYRDKNNVSYSTFWQNPTPSVNGSVVNNASTPFGSANVLMGQYPKSTPDDLNSTLMGWRNLGGGSPSYNFDLSSAGNYYFSWVADGDGNGQADPGEPVIYHSGKGAPPIDLLTVNGATTISQQTLSDSDRLNGFTGNTNTATYNGSQGTVDSTHPILVELYNDAALTDMYTSSDVTTNGAEYRSITYASTYYIRAWFDVDGSDTFDVGEPFVIYDGGSGTDSVSGAGIAVSGTATQNISFDDTFTNAVGVTGIFVTKNKGHNQTSSGVPASGGYEFLAVVRGMFNNTTATVTKPSGPAPLINSIPLTSQFNEFSASFTDQATMDTNFPNGSYTVSLAGNINRDYTVNLSGDHYPNTPQIINFTDTQAVDPASDFTITWNSFTPTTAQNTTSAIEVAVETDSEDIVFGLGQQPSTLTSMTVPAGTLDPNTTYNFYLRFYTIVDSPENEVLAIYESTVDAMLVTTAASAEFLSWIPYDDFSAGTGVFDPFKWKPDGLDGADEPVIETGRVKFSSPVSGESDAEVQMVGNVDNLSVYGAQAEFELATGSADETAVGMFVSIGGGVEVCAAVKRDDSDTPTRTIVYEVFQITQGGGDTILKVIPSPTTNIQADTPYRIGVVITPTAVRFYVNGNLDATLPIDDASLSTVGLQTFTSGRFFLGGVTNSSAPLLGYADNVEVLRVPVAGGQVLSDDFSSLATGSSTTFEGRAKWSEADATTGAVIDDNGNRYLRLDTRTISVSAAPKFIGILDFPESTAPSGPFTNLTGNAVIGADMSVDVRVPPVTGDYPVFVRFLVGDSKAPNNEFVTPNFQIPTDNGWHTVSLNDLRLFDLRNLDGSAEFSGFSNEFAIEFLVGSGGNGQTLSIDVDNINLTLPIVYTWEDYDMFTANDGANINTPKWDLETDGTDGQLPVIEGNRVKLFSTGSSESESILKIKETESQNIFALQTELTLDSGTGLDTTVDIFAPIAHAKDPQDDTNMTNINFDVSAFLKNDSSGNVSVGYQLNKIVDNAGTFVSDSTEGDLDSHVTGLQRGVSYKIAMIITPKRVELFLNGIADGAFTVDDPAFRMLGITSFTPGIFNIAGAGNTSAVTAFADNAEVLRSGSAPTGVYINKSRLHKQTSSAAPAVSSHELFANFMGDFANTSAVIVAPGKLPETFPISLDPEFSREFNSQSELDAAFPNSATPYVINFSGAINQSYNLTLNGDAYPNTPEITNYNEAQAVDHTQAFTVTFNSFTNPVTNMSFVEFSVETPQENILAGANVQDPTTFTSFTIPANTLQANTTYNAFLRFYTFVDNPGAGQGAAYEATVDATLKTQ